MGHGAHSAENLRIPLMLFELTGDPRLLQAFRNAMGLRWDISPTHDDVAVCCAPNAGRILPFMVDRAVLATEHGASVQYYGPITTTISDDPWAVPPLTLSVSGLNPNPRHQAMDGMGLVELELVPIGGTSTRWACMPMLPTEAGDLCQVLPRSADPSPDRPLRPDPRG